MTVSTNLSIRFKCGAFTDERVVLSNFEIPAYAEACFLHRQNLTKGETYSMQLKRGGKIIAERSGKLPMDWKNPLEWLTEIGTKVDKGLLGKLPFIGKMLESLWPDIQWQFDLWYQFNIDAKGQLEYKLHFGPSSTIEFRDKCEGVVSLI